MSVEGIAPRAGGFALETTAGPVAARRVVLAVPADAAARLLEAATAAMEGMSRALAEIPYAPVALVSLGWRREEVGHPLDGFGFLVPRKEGLRLLGCLFPSELFPGRAPEGHVALAAFAGGRTDPDLVSWDEERIAATLTDELRAPWACAATPPSSSSAAGRAPSRSTKSATAASSRWPGRSRPPSPASASPATTSAAFRSPTASAMRRRWQRR